MLFDDVREFQDTYDWDDEMMVHLLCEFIEDFGHAKDLERTLNTQRTLEEKRD